MVKRILALGPGTLLAKIDVESAFRNIPIHPHDCHLLGMLWGGCLYVDTTLPFGLRSAPKTFNAVADALQWIAIHRGVSYLDHFLDDFITECERNRALLVYTCRILNIPLAFTKQEGPAVCLIFLGIVLDTVKLELRLPSEKLKRLQKTLQEWVS